MYRDMGNINTAKNSEIALKTLQEGRELVRGDRFLEGAYWQVMADDYYQYGFQYHYPDLVNALQAAIQYGYPASDLYYKLGILYLRKGNFAEARETLDTGLRLEPTDGNLQSALSLLSQMEKKQVHSAP
jgi:tetratricopeptide (TPR) repeat protein